MDAYVSAGGFGRWWVVFGLFLVTQNFDYDVSSFRGLWGGAKCVLIMWLGGVFSLRACYGVGVVGLEVWRVLGFRGMYDFCVVCSRWVCECSC